MLPGPTSPHLFCPCRPSVTPEQVLSFTPFPKPVALHVSVFGADVLPAAHRMSCYTVSACHTEASKSSRLHFLQHSMWTVQTSSSNPCCHDTKLMLTTAHSVVLRACPAGSNRGTAGCVGAGRLLLIPSQKHQHSFLAALVLSILEFALGGQHFLVRLGVGL